MIVKYFCSRSYRPSSAASSRHQQADPESFVDGDDDVTPTATIQLDQQLQQQQQQQHRVNGDAADADADAAAAVAVDAVGNEGIDAIYLTPSDYLDSPYPVEVL